MLPRAEPENCACEKNLGGKTYSQDITYQPMCSVCKEGSQLFKAERLCAFRIIFTQLVLL